MAEYRYQLGDVVCIIANRRDPGGEGIVTARSRREDNRGEAILYRVLIPGHPQQEKVAADKHRENDGFWYAASLIDASAPTVETVRSARR